MDRSDVYRSLILTSFTTDFVNTLLFGSLMSGGCLYLLQKSASLDGRFLSNYISLNNIGCIKITPSHFEQLSTDISIKELLPKKLLTFGGEAV